MLAVEKKSIAKLQEERTVRKICPIDDHVVMAFAGKFVHINFQFQTPIDIKSLWVRFPPEDLEAHRELKSFLRITGLTADARVLIDCARVECQSHRLTVEDPVTLEYITRYIAQLKQRYTQSNGRRPFGITALLAGFDPDGTPRLFQTDPSGVYHEWKANATGRSDKTVREYLEKNYKIEDMAVDDKAIRLAIRALLEVVQGRNLEVAVMRKNQKLKMLDAKEIEKYVESIEKEKEEEAEKKKAKMSGQQQH